MPPFWQYSSRLLKADKYRGALRKILQTKFSDSDPNIEVVALVGKLPSSPSLDEQQQVLRPINGRMIAYDTLVQEALDSYKDYLDADERMSRLNAILEKVGATVEAPADGEPAEPDQGPGDTTSGAEVGAGLQSS